MYLHFFISIVVALMGILVAINPQAFITLVVILLGATTVCKGLHDIARVRPLSSAPMFQRTVLARSLVNIVVGALAVCLPIAFFRTVQGIIRILLYVQALELLFTAVLSVVLAVQLVADGLSAKPFVIEALSHVLVAVLLFLLPADFGVIIVRVAGIITAVYAALFAVYAWKNRTLIIQPNSIRDVTPQEEA